MSAQLLDLCRLKSESGPSRQANDRVYHRTICPLRFGT